MSIQEKSRGARIAVFTGRKCKSQSNTCKSNCLECEKMSQIYFEKSQKDLVKAMRKPEAGVAIVYFLTLALGFGLLGATFGLISGIGALYSFIIYVCSGILGLCIAVLHSALRSCFLGSGPINSLAARATH